MLASDRRERRGAIAWILQLCAQSAEWLSVSPPAIWGRAEV